MGLSVQTCRQRARISLRAARPHVNRCAHKRRGAVDDRASRRRAAGAVHGHQRCARRAARLGGAGGAAPRAPGAWRPRAGSG